jgi:hypothetical protein
VFRPIRLSIVSDFRELCCMGKETSRRASSQYELQTKEHQAHVEFEQHFKQLRQSWETRRLTRAAQTKY